MSGKMSERSISLKLVQDLVRTKKDHDLPPLDGVTAISPTRLLEQAATSNNFTLSASADFPSRITSSYFPRRTDELSAMSEIVGANLGALFLSMDGATIRVLDADYLLGTGTVLETLNVLDQLEDLSWSQDPNAAPDRIEVTYLPPSYDDSPRAFAAPYDRAIIWVAPKGSRLDVGESRTWSFDPGSFIMPKVPGPFDADDQLRVYGNVEKDGSGAEYDLPAYATMNSSGFWSVRIVNNSGHTVYLVAPTEILDTHGAPKYARGTRAFMVGTVDGADDTNGLETLTWGRSSDRATNVLTVALGRNIQRKVDAQRIMDRIVTRVTSPTYVLDDVRVVPNLGREIADLYRLEFDEAGFNTRAMVTGLKVSGSPDGVQQSLSLAVIPLTLNDFDAVWDAAHAGATTSTFDSVWDSFFPGATLNDFDPTPLHV